MSTDKAAPALTDTEALIIVRDAGLLEPMTAPQIARVHALVSAGYRAGCAARPAAAEPVAYRTRVATGTMFSIPLGTKWDVPIDTREPLYASPPAAEPPMSPAVLRAMDRFWSKADAVDAARYRFLRSPLAAQGGPVQVELWAEMGVKLCREEAMDREVDAAMRLLGVESPADASAAEAKEPK